MTRCHDYGHYHLVIALDEKPATPQDCRGDQAMIDTPLHGTDDEPCWYCGGTGEDQRRLCPNCLIYEPGEPSSPNPLKEG